MPTASDRSLIDESASSRADLHVICLQECPTGSRLAAVLQSFVGLSFLLVSEERVNGLVLFVFVRRRLLFHVGTPRATRATVRNFATSQMLTAKGFIALRMVMGATTLLLVGCHLSAGEEDSASEARKEDYAAIVKALRGKRRKVGSH